MKRAIKFLFALAAYIIGFLCTDATIPNYNYIIGFLFGVITICILFWGDK